MHKYPFLYKQCENTFGYDELIERLREYPILLEVINTNCMKNSATISHNINTEVYNELLDFLNGNGFSIRYLFNRNITCITPITKENVK